MTSHVIERATLDDLDEVAALFDAYRVFYEQPSDLPLARDFIGARMRAGESVILLARDADERTALGFTQLYPSFSSVRAEALWILNDLYVADHARRRGIARALLEAARQHAIATGAIRLTLSTAADNHNAQRLYESCGWQREQDWFYLLPVTH